MSIENKIIQDENNKKENSSREYDELNRLLYDEYKSGKRDRDDFIAVFTALNSRYLVSKVSHMRYIDEDISECMDSLNNNKKESAFFLEMLDYVIENYKEGETPNFDLLKAFNHHNALWGDKEILKVLNTSIDRYDRDKNLQKKWVSFARFFMNNVGGSLKARREKSYLLLQLKQTRYMVRMEREWNLKKLEVDVKRERENAYGRLRKLYTKMKEQMNAIENGLKDIVDNTPNTSKKYEKANYLINKIDMYPKLTKQEKEALINGGQLPSIDFLCFVHPRTEPELVEDLYYIINEQNLKLDNKELFDSYFLDYIREQIDECIAPHLGWRQIDLDILRQYKDESAFLKFYSGQISINQIYEMWDGKEAQDLLEDYNNSAEVTEKYTHVNRIIYHHKQLVNQLNVWVRFNSPY